MNKRAEHAAQAVTKSPLWLAVPAVVVLACVSSAVAQYEPLVFDPSLYEVEEEEVALAEVDAEAIEAANLEAALAEAASSGSSKASAGASSVGELADGTWTGYAACGQGNEDDWSPYYVAVTITVEDGAVSGITSIKGSSTGDDGDSALNWNSSENQEYLDWAISGRTVGSISLEGVKTQLDSCIASGSNPGSIDVVTGATYSSAAIFEAYYAALAKAAAAAGSSVDTSDVADSSSLVEASAGESGSTTVSVATGSINTLADGTWTGYAACGEGNEDDWSPYYVAVTLTVEGGAVASIDSIVGTSVSEDDAEALNWDADENEAYLNYAIDGRTKRGVTYTGLLEQLNAAVSAGEIASSYDTVSGATYSSTAIYEAYFAALTKSAAAAGSSIEATSGDEAASDGSDGAGEDASADSDDTGDATSDDDSAGSVEVTLVDGTYLGAAFCTDEDDPDNWSPYYVIVKIVVEDGAITTISSVYGDSQGVIDENYLYDKSENGTYLNRASGGTAKKTGVKTQIQNLLDAGEEPSEDTIDVISGATWSSYAIIHAYSAAADAALDAAVDAADASDGDEDADADGDADADADADGGSGSDSDSDSSTTTTVIKVYDTGEYVISEN